MNRQVKSDSSPNYGDLVARLRAELAEMASTASVDMELWSRFSNRVLEAANVIEEQAVRIEDIAEKYNNALLSPVTEKMLKNAVEEIVQLKAAIKPFALAADDYFDDDDDEPAYLKHFRIGDLRAARAVLEKKND